MAEVSDAPPDLGSPELSAVARLWKASRREVVCRFGGRSMAPALPPQAEVRLCCGQEGSVGDVMAFLDGGRMVVHRIVALAPDRRWILTRGDARLLRLRRLPRAPSKVSSSRSITDRTSISQTYFSSVPRWAGSPAITPPS